MSTQFRDEVSQWLMGLQDRICQGLEALDGQASFEEDPWQRPGGGGGRSRVLKDGALIEKGGVMFSAVHGPVSETMAAKLHLAGAEFFATGVSIVLHPRSPRMPIIHMNVRYFEMTGGSWWFGGGIDLTPHFVVPDQAAWFHRRLKAACDATDAALYPRFKAWADDYFYIKHRQETRGIGGIFYDRLGADEPYGREALWAMTQRIGESFLPIYQYMAAQNRDLPYTDEQVAWQRLRRGRYAEFNLVLDAGTKFGLETDGRTESILVSLPPLASWEYNHPILPGSLEAETQAWLRKGVDWA